MKETEKDKQIESYNSHLAHSVKSLFPPSWLEIVLYVVGAAVILCVMNYHILLNNLSNSSDVSKDALGTYLHNQVDSVSNFFSKLFSGRLATMLFWAFIGSIIYMVVWTLQNLIINIRNDMQAGEFISLRDQTGRRRAYWNSVVSSKVFLVCSIVAFAVFMVSVVDFFLPVISKTFGLAISDFHFPKSLENLIIAVVVGALFLYLLVILLRVIGRSWRWIVGNF